MLEGQNRWLYHVGLAEVPHIGFRSYIHCITFKASYTLIPKPARNNWSPPLRCIAWLHLLHTIMRTAINSRPIDTAFGDRTAGNAAQPYSGKWLNKIRLGQTQWHGMIGSRAFSWGCIRSWIYYWATRSKATDSWLRGRVFRLSSYSVVTGRYRPHNHKHQFILRYP